MQQTLRHFLNRSFQGFNFLIQFTDFLFFLFEQFALFSIITILVGKFDLGLYAIEFQIFNFLGQRLMLLLPVQGFYLKDLDHQVSIQYLFLRLCEFFLRLQQRFLRFSKLFLCIDEFFMLLFYLLRLSF